MTNSDLDEELELYGLSFDDMKKVAKCRMIKYYDGITKDELYYTLIRSEKTPQEESYLKYSNISTNNDIHSRINHIKVLTSTLSNKITNIERTNILEYLKELKKRYIESSNAQICKRVIRKVVKITNELYNIQKQHTKLQHDQTYFGLRDIKYLFNKKVDYEAIFVRSALKNRFEEYEIPGNREILPMREYLKAIYHSLKKLIRKKQKSTRDEQKVQLGLAAAFIKVNNPFDRYIEYVDSDALILRHSDDVVEFISNL